MKPNRKIVAMAWRYYHNNHEGRTIDKPFRGENWAQVLLAFGVPEDELYPDDRNRGLQRMTSNEAATKKWWKWKKVFAPELKRLEEANGPVRVEQGIKEEALEQAEENAKIEKILAESRADAKMWLIKDYPNRDAVELGEPQYWVLWYDPQRVEGSLPRGRVWNWHDNDWDLMFQSPYQLRPDNVYNTSVKVMFSKKYEENRNLDTEGAMLLEEWEDLMKQSPEGEKYLAAQDPDNMPLPNIQVNYSKGRSGEGKYKEMYVDEYGWLWDRKEDWILHGEPPIGHVVDGAHEKLKDRLLALFPTTPDSHPSRKLN